MEQHSAKKRNPFELERLLSCPLSGYQISGLFVDDLDLLVYHVPGEAVNRHACRAEALAKAGAPSNVIPP